MKPPLSDPWPPRPPRPPPRPPLSPPATLPLPLPPPLPPRLPPLPPLNPFSISLFCLFSRLAAKTFSLSSSSSRMSGSRFLALRFLRQSSKATSSMVSSFLMKAILLPPTMREMATMDSIPGPTLRERTRGRRQERGKGQREPVRGGGGSDRGICGPGRALGERKARSLVPCPGKSSPPDLERR